MRNEYTDLVSQSGKTCMRGWEVEQGHRPPSPGIEGNLSRPKQWLLSHLRLVSLVPFCQKTQLWVRWWLFFFFPCAIYSNEQMPQQYFSKEAELLTIYSWSCRSCFKLRLELSVAVGKVMQNASKLSQYCNVVFCCCQCVIAFEYSNIRMNISSNLTFDFGSPK